MFSVLFITDPGLELDIWNGGLSRFSGFSRWKNIFKFLRTCDILRFENSKISRFLLCSRFNDFKVWKFPDFKTSGFSRSIFLKIKNLEIFVNVYMFKFWNLDNLKSRYLEILKILKVLRNLKNLKVLKNLEILKVRHFKYTNVNLNWIYDIFLQNEKNVRRYHHIQDSILHFCYQWCWPNEISKRKHLQLVIKVTTY